MDLLSYQRTVLAFHDCDRRLRDTVLTGKKKLNASLNAYYWLGSGIYFWEHGPIRALEWAMQQSKRNGTKIKEHAVVGAIIQLSDCFDLLDIGYPPALPIHLMSATRRLCWQVCSVCCQTLEALPRHQNRSFQPAPTPPDDLRHPLKARLASIHIDYDSIV